MQLYINPITRANALSQMPYLAHARARRFCGASPPSCNPDIIARTIFNFYPIEPALNDNDENCIDYYVLDPFHPENTNANCVLVHNLAYEYDLNHSCRERSCVTTHDAVIFNRYELGINTAMDIPAIQAITSLHCAEPVLTEPVDGSKYYWMANSNGGQFDMKSTDPNGDEITFSVTPLPSGASYNPPGGVVTGPDINKQALFKWYPISPTQVGDYNLAVKANDGFADSNIANIFATVAPYSEIFTDPQAGGAPATFTVVSGVYVFDKPATVGQVWEIDLELPWLPTPEMWSFQVRNTGPCPLPGGSPPPQWNESLTNEAKARFTWTPDVYPPGGSQDICVSWRMMPGGGWIVSGLYHRTFRISFAPEMTLQSDPPETTQYAYVGELKIIDFSTDNGTAPYTYSDPNTVKAPPSAQDHGATWRDADTWGFNVVPAQLGATYTVTFQTTDSTTPTPETAQKVITITVTDLTFTKPTLDSFTANSGDNFSIELEATGGTPPYVFSFTSSPTSGDMSIETSPDFFRFNPAADGTYNIVLRVTDSMGVYYDKPITLVVGGDSCPPGQYRAGPGLCCLINEVEDPNNPGNCIASNSTIDIIDKNDFINDMNPSGFFSLCRMNDDNRTELLLQGVEANVNDMEFENTSNDYLLWNCRQMNRHYKWYKNYIFNPVDFDPSILVEP